MKLLGQILLVFLVLSAFQAIVAVIALALVLLIVWGFLCRPRETAGAIAFCLLVQALVVHPFVTIGLVALLFGVVLIARRKASRPPADPNPVELLPPRSGPRDRA